MINLIKQGNSLVITSDQDFPFEAGKIVVPQNALTYVIDESDIVCFRSVSNYDILFTGLLKDITINGTQATKDNLIQLFDAVGNAPMGGGGQGGGAVDSVNGKTGTVVITAEDVDAYSKKQIDDKGFLTSIPSEYVTENELTAKDYATKSDIPSLAGYATEEWVGQQNYATNTLVESKLDKNTYNEDKATFALKSELVDNVFDATELFTASQKPSDKTVTEEFQTAILSAISEKKVMVIHNGEVNVVVTFAQKSENAVMFTATNNKMLFFINLNTVTREVSIEQKTVGSGAFDKYSNELNKTIFDLTRESTNNDIQIAFTTDENGVKIPDVGDVVEVKDIDENITDSAIVISHIQTADNIDLIFMKNNIVDDFIVYFNLKINYNKAQGYDSMRVLRSTSYEVNPALITDTEMQALKGQIQGKQDKLVGTQTEGQNIKTINGQSLLGNGNIEITTSGGTGGKVDSVNGQIGNVVITAADLDAYTKEEIDNKNYLTSIPDTYTTDEELTAALAGKADTNAIKDMATKTWVGEQKFLKEIPTEYVTDEELNQKNYATKDELPSLVGYATEAWVGEQNYLKSVPENYVTDEELNQKNYATVDQLPNVEGKLDTSVYDEDKKTFATKSELNSKQDTLVGTQTVGQNIKTVNGQTLLGTGDIEIKVSSAVNSVNGETGDVTITAEGLGALTSIPDNYVTDEKLNLKNYATEAWVGEQNYLKSVPENYITEEELNLKNYATVDQLPNISGKLDKTVYEADKPTFATKEELNGKVNASEISDMATKTWVNDEKFLKSVPAEYVTETELNQKGYLTEHQDISGKLDVSVYNEEKKSFATKDEIPSLAGYAKEDWVNQQGFIKTVDAELSSVSENPVQNNIITAELNKKTESRKLTQEEYNQLTPEEKELNILYIITDAPEAATQAWTNEQLAAKQDTLVSGQNIKTINNQDITGSGNIEIQGGAVNSVNGQVGDVTITAEGLGALTSIPDEYVTDTELTQKGYSKTVEITQSEYDQLPTKDSKTLYVISDAPEINVNDFATNASVDEKINAAIAGVEAKITEINNKI